MTIDSNAFNIVDIATAGSLGALAGLFAAFLVLALILSIAVYVYIALTWYTIAKKLRCKIAWLAWIPVANLFLLPILYGWHWAWGFFFLLPLVYFVLAIIWEWKIFEKRKYPGWLALILVGTIIPVLSWIAVVAELVVFGLVAWLDKKR